ncbi:hypothetical protein SCHPADRAFT_890206 [Schizopora paradoxa]|uniref:Uncharacterized protein n=1 Tax=Schizopora paradoxa TaxID=27342 RepID=A0A0H2RMV8_9AGAM|nr:hypothetical protein SCHPADRAFT_890206 [Schizopora paradoxa]
MSTSANEDFQAFVTVAALPVVVAVRVVRWNPRDGGVVQAAARWRETAFAHDGQATVQARLQETIGLLRAILPSFCETWGTDVYGAELSALADFRRIANAKLVNNGHQA